ncbi:TIGR01777 family oxidoreductase [Lewinella sp. 4G2]|uniref:TIGR01777 family oxidoreductase n=1 Tax=Lewinella sp. 4G2 TaxID=1803372 RepID=UPI0007B4BC13|nr:TIGR01777 family oxidoreductase [Lewinella sp. 4G2]OAV42774.1 TIGR01777 family protein [Lewinella sp. 4G2]
MAIIKQKGIVLIGGGTGFIGSHLANHLADEGHQVRILTRSPKMGGRHLQFEWDTKKDYLDPAALKDVDYVINLAGAGIADKRWTAKRKKVIIESRTQTTALLAKGISKMAVKPKLYLSASAVGYYGDRGEELLTEHDGPRSGFLSRSCIAWEESTNLVAEQGVPVFINRTGIVLHPDGGALEKMLLPLHAFTSTYFGDGQQYYSWIHLEDIVRIYSFAIDNQLTGIYNGVAPGPVRNKQLAAAIGPAMGKAAVVIPAPAFAMKLAMGEMSHTVLDSAKVSSKKIEEAGFRFAHPELSQALIDLLR